MCFLLTSINFGVVGPSGSIAWRYIAISLEDYQQLDYMVYDHNDCIISKLVIVHGHFALFGLLSDH